MSKIKVLVVEDESIVSKDIQHSLKRLGYVISGASATGEKAIQLASEERPSIVLMDIMLKGDMNGIEAAERSEEHTSELQSRPHLVCRLLLEKKKKTINFLNVYPL